MAEVRESIQQGAPDEEELIAGARGADFDGMRIHLGSSTRLGSTSKVILAIRRRIDPSSWLLWSQLLHDRGSIWESKKLSSVMSLSMD